jgi:hypothetical protein
MLWAGASNGNCSGSDRLDEFEHAAMVGSRIRQLVVSTKPPE